MAASLRCWGQEFHCWSPSLWEQGYEEELLLCAANFKAGLLDSETALSQAFSSQAFSIQKGGEPLGAQQFCLGLSRPEAS